MAISKLKATVSIPESYFPYVKIGMKAQLTSDTYPDMIFPAAVYVAYPIIDPNTRTFDVEFQIDNNNMVLRPGMFTRLSLYLGKANVLVLPNVAILKTLGTNERYLFVDDKGIAKRQVVKIGARYNDLVEIVSDSIQAGMPIVIEGQGRLTEADSLSVVK